MKLNKNTQRLYSLLINKADASGMTQISIAELADELNVSFNTIVSSTARLESCSLLTVTRGQRSKNAKGKDSAGKNIYHVTGPTGEEK